jgi:cytochrome c-type biogenesis protein CcmE
MGDVYTKASINAKYVDSLAHPEKYTPAERDRIKNRHDRMQHSGGPGE